MQGRTRSTAHLNCLECAVECIVRVTCRALCARLWGLPRNRRRNPKPNEGKTKERGMIRKEEYQGSETKGVVRGWCFVDLDNHFKTPVALGSMQIDDGELH